MFGFWLTDGESEKCVETLFIKEGDSFGGLPSFIFNDTDKNTDYSYYPDRHTS